MAQHRPDADRPPADESGAPRGGAAQGEVAGGEVEGGEAACALHRVCDECGALEDGPPQPVCGRCGASSSSTGS